MKRSALWITSIAALPIALFGGAHAAGIVTLPTEWKVAPPAGAVAPTRPLPESARLTADGAHLVVSEAGAGGNGFRILDPTTLALQRTIGAGDAYGDVVPDAGGSGFWAVTGGDESAIHADAASGAVDRTIALPKPFWGAGLARSPDGKTLAVSGNLADAIVFVDVASGDVSAPIKVGHRPAGLAFSRDGSLLFVANWADASVSVVEFASKTARPEAIAVGRHPEALLVAPDGLHLYVSEPDLDAIAVVDLKTGARIAEVNVGIFASNGASAPRGASPSAMAFDAAESRLYVACGAANAIAALRVESNGSLTPLGAIPAGWYPLAVGTGRDGTLYVANGKGEGGHPNPAFQPNVRDSQGYVLTALSGSVRRIARPSEGALRDGLAIVRTGAGNAAGLAANATTAVRPNGPIKHVIYIIKENRTFDQVLGDIAGADGDPALTAFGSGVTPNQHAIAQRFGVFDAVFADAQVSADGHNWSTAAFANDYVEHMVPQNYGGHRRLYDFEDGADAAQPQGGYLWNAAVKAGLALRDYGEFVTNGATKDAPATTQMADLKGRIDPNYPGYDLTVSDLDREAEWAKEFAGYVSRGDLPALEIVRLPNDHTAATRPGSRTPAAFVGQNDLAFGRLVDAVSHSPYWKETAIFSVEDDAQNGPDHVDEQRMTVYLASPYATGGVRHERSSTAGVLRTIEIILGLPPLSAYDAGANPLYAALDTRKPDLRPFDALPARTDLNAINGRAAYRAADSARFDLRHADAVPPAEMNDILAHAGRSPAR